MKSYLAHFEFKSIETNDFKQYLLDYFKDNPKINEIDWNTWLYSPGMPPAIPKYVSLEQVPTSVLKAVVISVKCDDI